MYYDINWAILIRNMLITISVGNTIIIVIIIIIIITIITITITIIIKHGILGYNPCFNKPVSFQPMITDSIRLMETLLYQRLSPWRVISTPVFTILR